MPDKDKSLLTLAIVSYFAIHLLSAVWCPLALAEEQNSLQTSAHAAAFLEDRQSVEPPRPASFLAAACQSKDPFISAYCDEYIEGAAHLWRWRDTCQSADADNLQYCAGVEAAQHRIETFFANCADCDWHTFRPDMKDEDQRSREFLHRQTKLPAEIQAALGACTKAGGVRTAYCVGYEAEVESSIAGITVMYPGDLTPDPKLLGRGDGRLDTDLHLWFSSEFVELQTCTTYSIKVREFRRYLLVFLDRYPDQVHVDTAVILLGRALNDAYCDDAKEGRPHMEACVDWKSSDGGEFVGENICGTTVVIQFTSGKQTDEIKKEVAPGGYFRTGLRNADAPGSGWIFTACPPGHRPSIPFGVESTSIRASRYTCIRDP